MSGTATQAAGDGGAGKSRFLLEAHYYEGGSRSAILAGSSVRPGWVPPPDYVGLRNEMDLAPGDAVVEFARFLFEKRRVTWIGVFHRAIDKVLGDRQNHAGAGLWLLDTDVVDAANLLHGLRQFARKVADGEMETVLNQAMAFAGDKYLPKYILPSRSLPDAFGGWPYNAMPETELFLAPGKQAAEAWDAAAEQILRMSNFPARSPSLSRALILVPASAARDAGPAARKGLTPVGKGFASELLAYLPEATAQIVEENRRSAEELRVLANRLLEQDVAVKGSLETGERLQSRVRELEEQIEENDILKKLDAMGTSLRDLQEKARNAEPNLRNIQQDLASIRTALNRLPASPSVSGTRAVGEMNEERRPDPRPPGGERLEIPLLALIIFGVATLLLLFWLYSSVTGGLNREAVAPLAIPAPSELKAVVEPEEPPPSTGIEAEPGNALAPAVPENTEARLEDDPVPAPR